MSQQHRQLRAQLPVIARAVPVALALLLPPLTASADGGILGQWVTEDRLSRIELAPCGDAICGRVSWIHPSEALDAQGRPVTDERNPKRSLRDRPILGLRIFHGLRRLPDNEHTWAGKVYNPDNGKTYNVRLTPQDNGALRVKGCLFDGWLCLSERWTRR